MEAEILQKQNDKIMELYGDVKVVIHENKEIKNRIDEILAALDKLKELPYKLEKLENDVKRLKESTDSLEKTINDKTNLSNRLSTAAKKWTPIYTLFAVCGAGIIGLIGWVMDLLYKMPPPR